MKKLIQTMIFAFIFIILANISCKKNQLQPTSLWLKNEYVIFKNLSVVHQNNLNKIKEGRTTVGEFWWGNDLITVHGPAAYETLATHATADFNVEFENSILKDTTNLDTKGMMASMIDSYLDKCQKYDADKSFDKMYITIPKPLYEVYVRGWERILSDLHWYLTGPIAGNYEYNRGTRLLWFEKELRGMLREPDENFEDDWKQNLSFNVYLHYYYLISADGSSNKSIAPPLISDTLAMQNVEAAHRYLMSSHYFGGDIEEYKTQYDKKSEVYYLNIPVKKIQ